jgi:hypothetical protein
MSIDPTPPFTELRVSAGELRPGDRLVYDDGTASQPIDHTATTGALVVARFADGAELHLPAGLEVDVERERATC